MFDSPPASPNAFEGMYPAVAAGGMYPAVAAGGVYPAVAAGGVYPAGEEALGGGNLSMAAGGRHSMDASSGCSSPCSSPIFPYHSPPCPPFWPFLQTFRQTCPFYTQT